MSRLMDEVFEAGAGQGQTIEVLVVDDGSGDRTAEIAEAALEGRPGKLLRHEKNKGKGAALKTALQAAVGDVVIVQDADLEYDPHDIARCVEPIVRGECEVVYGSRRLNKENMRHSSVWFFLGGILVTKVFNLLYGGALTDEPTCYKAFRRGLIAGIDIESDGFEWEPEITAKLARKRVSIHEVAISYNPRAVSEGKKISWLDGVKAIWTLVVYRFR